MNVQHDDIAERARSMHKAGHGLHDIASVLGMHPEQIRRWLAIPDPAVAEAAHAARRQETHQ